ncbi:unnamed protein product [Heligmosomoides polygyrus]|uniref:Uncharacterized protein n=1 Tax=Heligmosomoides polygyrus TaxID=6339 RepID=A0A183G891_HELPZ|nr:unnamed protein product [Heligmosomoides polygyrus]
MSFGTDKPHTVYSLKTYVCGSPVLISFADEQKRDNPLQCFRSIITDLELPIDTSEPIKTSAAKMTPRCIIKNDNSRLASALQLAWQQAAEHARTYKTSMKRVYDQKARPSTICEGGRVFFRNYTSKSEFTRKFRFPWIGQFRVLKVDHPQR